PFVFSLRGLLLGFPGIFLLFCCPLVFLGGIIVVWVIPSLRQGSQKALQNPTVKIPKPFSFVLLAKAIPPERFCQIQFLQLAQLAALDQELMLTVIFARSHGSQCTRTPSSKYSDRWPRPHFSR